MWMMKPALVALLLRATLMRYVGALVPTDPTVAALASHARASSDLRSSSAVPTRSEFPALVGDEDAYEVTLLDQHEFPPAQIIYPLEGAVIPLPVTFNCLFTAEDNDRFFRKHGYQQLCIEIDRQWRKCEPMAAVPPQFADLPSGNHSVIVFLVENDTSSSVTGERLLESTSVQFTVLREEEYRAYGERQKQRDRELFGIAEGVDLLTWASSQASKPTTVGTCDASVPSSDASQTSDCGDESTQQLLELVIGVKTSVVQGFASRQAIRATWASRASLRAHGVKVYFVGCQPVLFDVQHRAQRQELIDAIEMEKQQFGDLLTDELECEDSYFSLPTKVKEFLHFAATEFSQVPYVMIADDDIYLQMNQLTQALRQHGRRTQFYAGQVWAKLFLRVAPIRDPDSKSYLSEAQYPMNDLPSFAFGPHYVMSMDCAEFIGSNRHELAGLSASDDVSVGLWLLAMQVHPEHQDSFQGLRIATCTENGPVALADLTSHAIRIIHANLKTGAPFCRGFNLATWQKPSQSMSRLRGQRSVNVAVRVSVTSGQLQVVTEVTLEFGVTAKSFVFSPAENDFQDHSAQVCKYLNRIQDFSYNCEAIAEQIHGIMIEKLDQLAGIEAMNSA